MYSGYVWNYVKLRFSGKSHWDAYSELPSEVEAYDREHDPDMEVCYKLEKAR